MLSKLVGEFTTMFLFGVLIVPHDSARLLIYNGTINILAVLSHQLFHSRHPLLVLYFEKFAPLLFLVCLKPVATLSSNPKVLLLHQIGFKDLGHVIAMAMRENYNDVILVEANRLEPVNDLSAWAHL